MYVGMHIYIYIHTPTYIYTYTHVYMYMCIYIYIYIHIYICSQQRPADGPGGGELAGHHLSDVCVVVLACFVVDNNDLLCIV